MKSCLTLITLLMGLLSNHASQILVIAPSNLSLGAGMDSSIYVEVVSNVLSTRMARKVLPSEPDLIETASDTLSNDQKKALLEKAEEHLTLPKALRVAPRKFPNNSLNELEYR